MREVSDKEGLLLLRLSHNKELETIKALDLEVIELIKDESALAGEIDEYKESVFHTLIKVNRITKAPLTTSSPTPAVSPTNT